MFGPKTLPEAFRTDWVANANDSYWPPDPKQRLEGYDRIIGCERCERSLRTRMVYRYVLDRLAGTDGLAEHDLVSPLTLRLFQHTNRVFGAELTRQGNDLQEVCEPGLAGHCVAGPFDARYPRGTPRNLVEDSPAVVTAMRDALAHLAENGIPLDVPWGTLQVAGSTPGRSSPTPSPPTRRRRSPRTRPGCSAGNGGSGSR